MNEETISFETDEQKLSALDTIAAALNRDRTFVINDAIDTYLQIHQWQIEEIKKALAEADAGKFASTEAVEAFFARWTDDR
ncbi:MAG TPA: CopG family transcriptional regulator [Blastocatellia bacterium]|nr:CopG family transcriptional regulator [Blastocatellia bacterium]